MRWKAPCFALVAVGVATLILWSSGGVALFSSESHLRSVGGSRSSPWSMPSILSGIMSTPNEAADDIVSHNTTPSPVVDSLLGATISSTGLSGAAAKINPFHGGSDCLDATNAMTPRYEEAVQRHLSSLGVEQPDVWAGPSPLCGVNKLFNLTHLVLTVANGSKMIIHTGRPATFAVRMCGSSTLDEKRCPDVYLAARLVGPSIVNAHVQRLVGSCDFQIETTPFDQGSYRLEVQVVWYNSLGPEHDPPSSPITLRKIHSKFGKKPHQKYAFNAACEEQTHVLGSPLAVEVVGSGFQLPSSTAVCSGGMFPQGGRWVTNTNDKECEDNHRYCMGRPYLLNDAKPFNEDFLWAPVGCRFRFWGRGDGPKHLCVRRSGTMLLMGDSTTREYAQSLRLFDLSRTGLAVSYANWKLEWQFFSRRMAEESLQRLGQELKKTRPVVLVANLGPLHLIGGLKTSEWKFYVDQWAQMLKSNGLEFVERKIFLGPAAIHYATNDMTAPRMLLWMKYAQEQLEPLGFELLDGWSVTQSRPESTWDGVHYAAERGKAQMKHIRRKRPVFKWNGGVSIMLATILLNMLCRNNSGI